VRVAYLIQSHREPAQLLRLVATLKRGSPRCWALVAHDTTGAALDPALLAPWPGVFFLPVPGPCERGRLSLLDPWFAGVARLRELGVDYDWLVYLSAQDYPVRPLAESEAFLAASECDGYLRFWRALAPDTPWGRPRQGDRRYHYRYFDLPRWATFAARLVKSANGVQSLVHANLVYGPRVGVRRRRLPLPDGWTLYGGWQWTTLRRACAEHVLEAVGRQSALVEYFRATICPDEALVQTLLVNSGHFRLTDDNLRYVDSRGTRDGRPRLLGEADLAVIAGGAYHFARKFDLARDPQLFELLDRRLEPDCRP
jgi:hypothetical protein